MAILGSIARRAARPGGPSPVRIWLVLAALLLTMPTASAQRNVASEYQLKAVFLFNFAQFVDWPPRALPPGDSPLVIGVLGDDPFQGALDNTVRGEQVRHHPIVVQRYRRVEEIRVCHILFISNSEKGRLPQIFAALKDRSILTVGEDENFSRYGGIIRFYNAQNKIRFRIDVEAARAASLTISSKLLRPAEIVQPGDA